MKQQEASVMLSSLKGPRQFYRHMRGDQGVLLYDLVTVAGSPCAQRCMAWRRCCAAATRGGPPRHARAGT